MVIFKSGVLVGLNLLGFAIVCSSSVSYGLVGKVPVDSGIVGSGLVV